MRDQGDKRLTDRQRRLVEQNIGLVAVHLRQHVGHRCQPTREREWEDLFQEGCLALARAAAAYDEKSGTPFAAYALKRIRAAVHRALQRRFSTIVVPEYRQRADRTSPAGRSPRVVALGFDPPTRSSQGRHDPFDPPGTETVSSRLRAKITQAMQVAARETGRSRGAGDRRAVVVERVVNDRLLIPDGDSRVPLRQIARETGASYARVAWTEKRVLERARRHLTDDPETRELRRACRRHADGLNAPAPTTCRSEMDVKGGLHRVFTQASARQRARLLTGLMEAQDTQALGVARTAFEQLSEDQQQRWLAWASEVLGPTGDG